MKKYALWVKCLAFTLAVVLLLCVAVSALGILVAESMSMYSHDGFKEWRYTRCQNMAETLAYQVMDQYAGGQSGSPQWVLEQTGHLFAIHNGVSWYELSEEDWYYTITAPDGRIVADTEKKLEDPMVFVFDNMSASYPVIVIPPDTLTSDNETTQIPATAKTEEPAESVPTEAVTEQEEVPTETCVEMLYDSEEYYNIYYDPVSNEEVWVQYDQLENYRVTIGVRGDHSGYYVSRGFSIALLEWLFSVRYCALAAAAGSLLLFVLVFVFLLSIVGRDPVTGEANPKALNRLPLDLYLISAAFITYIGLWCAYELLDELLFNENYNVLIAVLLCGCGIVVATMDIGFFTAVAAQFKLPGRFWWKHSVCGRVLNWLLGWLKKVFLIGRKGINRVFGMLPVIWKWIAAGGALGFVLVLICATTTAHWYSIFPLCIWCLVFAVLVIYCGYGYGVIQKGIQRMKAGDLNEKINTGWLFGSFKTIAEDLNALADVVVIAAEKQLKAERMKAELITNVSHDIKTPLTSVINYVDLLQQPHTEEEGTQYLEVLSRQSARLKKLVEDLMDMSKASTGNMAVNVTDMDAVEAVNQALGEFADKLEMAELTTVFRPQTPQVSMRADGRVTWRVLSNILSNVVKYALPGTRVYLDLQQEERWVVLSVKNISREELNISAEELTERFVRGDVSRNTEGSGLGLNIAQSLMRLQHGNMEVTVDGDLFKVTLIFPTK